MNLFLKNIFRLTILTMLTLLISLFFIKDKATNKSILAALPDKHLMLQKITKPKIILLGGSNVSFGIDSKQIETHFHKLVVNTGIHAGMGLQFIVNDIKPYIKNGDVIILFPEYEHFYTDNFYGEMELLPVIFEIEPSSKNLLNTKQWLHILKYILPYSAKKIKNYIPFFSGNAKSDIVDIYHRKSFNKYGDAYLHWEMPNQNFAHAQTPQADAQINDAAITFLVDFNTCVNQRGAKLLIFPPVIAKTSYNKQKTIITKIVSTLKNSDIAFSTEPINYCYDDTLFFNSYYHLNKGGVDKRTVQIINDLNLFLN